MGVRSPSRSRSSYVLLAKVSPRGVQVVRPASQPQIGGCGLAALCIRDCVIELQQTAGAAAAAVSRAESAAALVPNVHFSAHSSRDVTGALQGLAFERL